MRLSLRLASILLIALFLQLAFREHQEPSEKTPSLRSSSSQTRASEDPSSTTSNSERNMGSNNSTPAQTKDYITTNALEVYVLKKKRPGCTGMFWRKDPTGKLKLKNNNDWPRDSALLKGQAMTVKGEKWLAATQVKQARGEWVDAPYGAYIPFEYDNHYYLEKTVEQ